MPVEVDSSSLRGTVAFTGRLVSMKRTKAFALVRQLGGIPRRGVTKRTGVLVVGEFGWPLLEDGRPSNSLNRAKTLAVPIVSERRFQEWIGQTAPDEQYRTVSADKLAALSQLPTSAIEQLVIFGLLDIREGLFGFRDVAAARQIARLLASGVQLSTITRSLHEIRKWFPEAGLSNLRLSPSSADAILVENIQGRTNTRGQFVLPVDAALEDPDVLFEHAQSAEEAGDAGTAERIYRRVMRIDPDDPAAPFNLGNLLRAAGRTIEAEVAYRAATESDPTYAEAWYNLADLLDERGRAEEAIASLKQALLADPHYTDATFNLALLLQRFARLDEATQYWRHYLSLDVDSSWAARARVLLKYCEIQRNKAS
jgi:tetratricopeptide (TPR) repeat protein